KTLLSENLILKSKQWVLTNFIVTVAGVSAVVMLLRSDVKQSATVFKRNVKHISKKKLHPPPR
ncbi:unnamed protein product, partial [Brassica oleracea]